MAAILNKYLLAFWAHGKALKHEQINAWICKGGPEVYKSISQKSEAVEFKFEISENICSKFSNICEFLENENN